MLTRFLLCVLAGRKKMPFITLNVNQHYSAMVNIERQSYCIYCATVNLAGCPATFTGAQSCRHGSRATERRRQAAQKQARGRRREKAVHRSACQKAVHRLATRKARHSST